MPTNSVVTFYRLHSSDESSVMMLTRGGTDFIVMLMSIFIALMVPFFVTNRPQTPIWFFSNCPLAEGQLNLLYLILLNSTNFLGYVLDGLSAQW